MYKISFRRGLEEKIEEGEKIFYDNVLSIFSSPLLNKTDYVKALCW